MTLDQAILGWWDGSGLLASAISGGLWRDVVPEVNESGQKVVLPYARFTITNEDEVTADSAGQVERRTIVFDVWDADPARLRGAKDALRKRFDDPSFDPYLEPDESFIRADWSRGEFAAETVEKTGQTVWHATMVYVMVVQVLSLV
jgi:hypothetical protein